MLHLHSSELAIRLATQVYLAPSKIPSFQQRIPFRVRRQYVRACRVIPPFYDEVFRLDEKPREHHLRQRVEHTLLSELTKVVSTWLQRTPKTPSVRGHFVLFQGDCWHGKLQIVLCKRHSTQIVSGSKA